ncbi:hypothetical protein J2X36_004512 [Methylobacterium sp. BE186]|uniref:hypothetical protein n=1 Tax=Methylobacterium sp. BE186 TaxID=2817715 RepID=UPI00286600C9|nr:hypothetical protein [Methylobacterium sp. BE186]MDR7037786.1 hypothetical protein [Methylobacterium sp. BE186]MDR7039734.1 hypothetical protein [Methylobacterium sp. BE186]
MSELEEKRVYLAQADRHIAEGETRIADQVALIARLKKDGHDLNLARDFLHVLVGTLAQWNVHRQLILNRIAQLTTPEP